MRESATTLTTLAEKGKVKAHPVIVEPHHRLLKIKRNESDVIRQVPVTEGEPTTA